MVKQVREYVYPATLDMCIRHPDGSISHAKEQWAEQNWIWAIDDRPECERLSDGSIAHVPSTYTLDPHFIDRLNPDGAQEVEG